MIRRPVLGYFFTTSPSALSAVPTSFSRVKRETTRIKKSNCGYFFRISKRIGDVRKTPTETQTGSTEGFLRARAAIDRAMRVLTTRTPAARGIRNRAVYVRMRFATD